MNNYRKHILQYIRLVLTVDVREVFKKTRYCEFISSRRYCTIHSQENLIATKENVLHIR